MHDGGQRLVSKAGVVVHPANPVSKLVLHPAYDAGPLLCRLFVSNLISRPTPLPEHERSPHLLTRRARPVSRLLLGVNRAACMRLLEQAQQGLQRLDFIPARLYQLLQGLGKEVSSHQHSVLATAGQSTAIQPTSDEPVKVRMQKQRRLFASTKKRGPKEQNKSRGKRILELARRSMDLQADSGTRRKERRI